MFSVGARLLVIAPHPDDDILGAGGTIARALDTGGQVAIVYMTGNRDAERGQESQAALRKLTPRHWKELSLPRFTYLGHPDGGIDRIDTKEAITALDRIVNWFKPHIALFCKPGYHQDHNATYQICSAALRPRPERTWLQIIAAYETPACEQNQLHVPKNNLYVDISPYINKKILAFREHRSQVDQDPAGLMHPANVRDLARMRGTESGHKYAEAYSILKVRI
jgi:N-acetylglucosamine malate deacetylase 1